MKQTNFELISNRVTEVTSIVVKSICNKNVDKTVKQLETNSQT